MVSGHTDNIPINTYRFRSNWELSSSRAVSVIHELSKESDLKDKSFKIVAYADTQPLEMNDTWEGRARNRRVEIMMDYANSTKEKDDDLKNLTMDDDLKASIEDVSDAPATEASSEAETL